MRTILMALILGISVGSVAAPARAEDERDLGGQDRFVVSDSGAPQIGVGVVAGSDEEPPAVQDRYEKN